MPITLIMVSGLTVTRTRLISQLLVGILRHYVLQLLTSAPKKQTLAAMREQ